MVLTSFAGAPDKLHPGCEHALCTGTQSGRLYLSLQDASSICACSSFAGWCNTACLQQPSQLALPDVPWLEPACFNKQAPGWLLQRELAQDGPPLLPLPSGSASSASGPPLPSPSGPRLPPPSSLLAPSAGLCCAPALASALALSSAPRPRSPRLRVPTALATLVSSGWPSQRSSDCNESLRAGLGEPLDLQLLSMDSIVVAVNMLVAQSW